MVVSVTVEDTLDVTVDLELDLDEVLCGVIPHDLDFVLNLKVNLDSGSINKIVTSTSEDDDLSLNPLVNVSGGDIDLNLSIEVEFSNNINNPLLDSDCFSVDFGLTVIFKISNHLSPVMDDKEFLLGIVGSPPDAEFFNCELNFQFDLEGEFSNSSVGIISKSLDGNFGGGGNGDFEFVDSLKVFSFESSAFLVNKNEEVSGLDGDGISVVEVQDVDFLLKEDGESVSLVTNDKVEPGIEVFEFYLDLDVNVEFVSNNLSFEIESEVFEEGLESLLPFELMLGEEDFVMCGDIGNHNFEVKDDSSGFLIKSVGPEDVEGIKFFVVLCDDSYFGGDVDAEIVFFELLDGDLSLNNDLVLVL